MLQKCLNCMALRYVLPQLAAFTDADAWTDVDPVPDAGICADLRTIVDDGGFVGVVAHGSVLER